MNARRLNNLLLFACAVVIAGLGVLVAALFVQTRRQRARLAELNAVPENEEAGTNTAEPAAADATPTGELGTDAAAARGRELTS